MLTLKTQNQVTRIVNNIVVACKDITKLNKTGYDYIHLASGFIAHYDLHRFISYYLHNSFIYDLLKNISNNQYNNFHPGDENYEYYKQKAEIYKLIVSKFREMKEAESWEESYDIAHHDMEL